MMYGWWKVVIDFMIVNFVDFVGVKIIKWVIYGDFDYVIKIVIVYLK